MSNRRNPLKARPAKRRVKKLIYVLCEGSTEQDYLAMDSITREIRQNDEVVVTPVKHHRGRTDPASLTKTMRTFLKEKKDFRSTDEAWIVCDADDWPQEKFEELMRWEQEDSRHHVALSNPKFEVYLLMHCGDVQWCGSAAEVDRRLKRVWPQFAKRIPRSKFSLDEVKAACAKAEARCPDGASPFSIAGSTSFHRLVRRLISSSL